MTKKIKSSLLSILGIVTLIFMLATIFVANQNKRVALANEKENYYQSGLSDEGKVFYNALEDMLNSGQLAKGDRVVLGSKYDCLSENVGDFLQGGGKLLYDFHSAVNCFNFDHGEVFWIDFDKLDLNVYKDGDNYLIQIGAGRLDNYFIDDFVGQNIQEKIDVFNQNITAFLGEEIYLLGSDEQKIKLVNQKITENIQNSKQETQVNKYYDTAFSALNGVASSQGISKLFNVCMQKLGIDSVLVGGYTIDKGGINSHYWNSVKLKGDDFWLGVDASLNIDLENKERYLLCDDSSFNYNHYTLSKIKNGTQELNYPELKQTKTETIDDGVMNILTPSNFESKMHAVGCDIFVNVRFSKNLIKIDENLPVGVTFTYESYDGEEVNDETLRKETILDPDSVIWLDFTKTLAFNFKASDLFEHNAMRYTFTIENLKFQDDGTLPRTFSGYFGRKNVYCDKILSCSGSPEKAVDPSLSKNNLITFGGGGLSEHTAVLNQISNLLLVGNENQTAQKYFPLINEKVSGSLLKASAIELEFYLSGYKSVIPLLEPLKINFDFPGGYDETTPTTYKVFKFLKNNNGDYDYQNPIEINCVVSKYGVCAPICENGTYIVCACDQRLVKNDYKAVDLSIISGLGSINQKLSGGVYTLSENQSLTFDITPATGYMLDYVLVNGENVKCENNQLTVLYSDLYQNNTVIVSFVSEVVLGAENQNGVKELHSEYYSNVFEKTISRGENTPSGSKNIKNVVIVLVCLVLIFGVGVIIGVFAIKNIKAEKVNDKEDLKQNDQE